MNVDAKSLLGFGIEEHGADVAARHLQGLAKQGEDPRPAFQQIIDELRAGEAGWFATHGEGGWPRLAESTLERKERQGLPRDPLVASRDLLRSLTVKRGRGAIRSATKTRMRFGSKLYYALFHDRGTGVPQRRPVLPVDVRTRKRMVKDVRDHMMKGTQG